MIGCDLEVKIMPTTVNIHEAKTHLSRLLERVRAGEEIVVAKAGTPIARIVPYEDEKARVPGIVEGRVDDLFFEPLPEEELAGWDQPR